MSGTHFQSMVYAQGIPVVGAIQRQGKNFFVDPYLGSDGNPGTEIDKAFRTLNRAEAACSSGRGDTVYLVSGGTTTANITSYLSETLVWDKEKTNIIGLAAPSVISPRARMSILSTVATAINPMLQITASGCVFANFQAFAGIDAAVAANAVEVTGQRNYFYRVHFAGIGNAKNDVANAYSLKLTGADENLFEECEIGLETTAKGTAANSEIVFASACERNVFKRCTIRTYAEAAGHQFILAGASALEGTQIFEDCYFLNKMDGGATGMTEAISINATQNGQIALLGKTSTNAADWEASPTGVVVQNLIGSDPGILSDVS